VRTWLYSLAAAIFALFLLAIWVRTFSPTISPYVQFQAGFSKDQMAFFYAKTRRDLRQNYVRGLARDAKALQLKTAWHELWNGPGAIQGILTDFNSNVLAFVKFKDGNSYWLTVQPTSNPGFAKVQP